MSLRNGHSELLCQQSLAFAWEGNEMFFAIEIGGDVVAFVFIPAEGVFVGEIHFLHCERQAVRDFVRHCLPHFNLEVRPAEPGEVKPIIYDVEDFLLAAEASGNHLKRWFHADMSAAVSLKSTLARDKARLAASRADAAAPCPSRPTEWFEPPAGVPRLGKLA